MWQLKSGERVVNSKNDHVSTHAQVLGLLPEALGNIESDSRDFFVATVDMGRIVGETICVGTTDADEIVFARRPRRFGFTRFVKNRNPEPTDKVTVVLKQGRDSYILITAFVGDTAPAEPWDQNADENSTVFWTGHALVFGAEEQVSGTELPETPASAEAGQDNLENLQKVLEQAWVWGAERHPGATNHNHAAFANSVGELVTGWAVGYGGPSIRQYGACAEANRLGRHSGQTTFAEACVLAEEACYGPISPTHVFCCVSIGAFPGECTFDDSPGDIAMFWEVVRRLPERLRQRVQW